MRKKSILISLLALASTTISAQSSHIRFDKLQDFRKAKYLFLTETYQASADKFEKVLLQKNLQRTNQEEAEFYAALSGLMNDERGAEKRFLAFEKKYPKSIYMQNATWELGSFYLQNGEYQKAYDLLRQHQYSDFPERKRNEFQFKLGYAAFMLSKKNEALQNLEPLIQSEKFQDEAAYYTGHIYYEQKNYDKAFQYFDALKNRNPEYASRVLPYVVQISFNNQNYENAIAEGLKLLQSNQDPFIQSEVAKIIGESYFQLKKYDQAIPYLEKYQGGKSDADFYQLGYAYYQKGDFDTAISYLNKIIDADNELAQTAYYQLGNAYLQTQQKKQALTAFQSASEFELNPQIQEDASYNYAKLSYDIGNPFKGTPEVLQHFLQQYPKSKYQTEINDLLIDAYISSGNYANALSVLSKLTNKDQKQKNAEQQAAFLYGTQLINEGKINESEPYFDLAAKTGDDITTRKRAIFWLGETRYRQDKFSSALQYFNQFETLLSDVPEDKEIMYQLGYTHLKLKNYANAISALENYLATNPPGNFKGDAKLRLADAYIGNQQTQRAIQLYKEVADAKINQSDEAAYNSAVAFGILGETGKKINALESFLQEYPKSHYYNNAQYELALAYTQTGNKDKAIQHIDRLIKHGNAAMAARARLQKGVIFNNGNQSDKALKEFQYIAENYPNTQIALDAINGAKRIYLENNDLNGFESWANTLGYYQINSSELELLSYSAAQDAFTDKNHAQAIELLSLFNQKYPNSTYQSSVQYYLGESYYQTQAYDAAINPLENVALNKNDFQEDGMLRLSQIYINQQEDTKALLMLENLNQITSNKAYKTFAEVHLMRLYSKKGLYQKAVSMADKVLINEKNETTVMQEAELTKARSLMSSEQLNLAKSAYQNLEKSSSNAIKAEAFYYKAYFLNQENSYQKSNDVVFDLASKYAEQQYWGSNALVLMANNYFMLGDLYQAQTTADAVIQNYEQFPEVVQEAKSVKQKIQSK